MQTGISDYMPMNYSEVSKLWEERKLNVFYSAVAPMDENGYLSFGLVASENT